MTYDERMTNAQARMTNHPDSFRAPWVGLSQASLSGLPFFGMRRASPLWIFLWAGGERKSQSGNPCRTPKHRALGIRASSFGLLSSFVIRHSSFPAGSELLAERQFGPQWAWLDLIDWEARLPGKRVVKRVAD